MKQGSFPLSGFVVRYLIGTMNPSDSLPAVVQLPLSVYMPSVYGLPCRVGSLQFHTILYLHAVSHTPEDSSVVLQVPSTFHGLRPCKRDSASSCSPAARASSRRSLRPAPVTGAIPDDAAEFTSLQPADSLALLSTQVLFPSA